MMTESLRWSREVNCSGFIVRYDLLRLKEAILRAIDFLTADNWLRWGYCQDAVGLGVPSRGPLGVKWSAIGAVTKFYEGELTLPVLCIPELVIGVILAKDWDFLERRDNDLARDVGEVTDNLRGVVRAISNMYIGASL